ncbi:MAG TPA: PQQ-binding-like beta-propeller repeat protein [Pseudonocardiaceae bacterium]|nr:PQQ-binding-like beta-propeller repeat protein [Pseudonocardiaceae bacterium]
MRDAHRAAAVAALVVAAGLLAACTSAPPQQPAASPTPTTTSDPPTSAVPVVGADWTTYHHDNARTGTAAGLAPLGTLSTAWRAKLDGAVYGQPLVVGDTILAATENDTVYGLNASSGATLWSAHLGTPVPRSGLPCGDIDPLGITGTMVYDPATGLVFALAETTGGTHTLYGIDARTGKVAVRTGIEPPAGDKIAHQQRAALTLLNGRIYVAYGGLFGDCGNYIGSVVSVTTSGADPLHYAVPTGREGGIWNPGGATVSGATLLYTVGNGESTRGQYDGSDSVIALSPTLNRTDVFAPTSWPQDNASDLDLSSGSAAVLDSWVFVAGKRGTGYVMTAGHLGGVGGQVAQAQVCRSFGGTAIAGERIIVPCPEGPMAVTIAANGTPSVAWHAPVAAGGSPTVGGGAIWVVDYDAGVLYALDPADGHVRARVDIGTAPHFASPTLSGSRAYVGTNSGVVAVAGA